MQKLNIHNNHYISYKQQKYGSSQTHTIVFLHGLMSDKNGTKALSIENFCKKEKYNYVSFDNLGHGESTGKFMDHTISCWLNTTRTFLKSLNIANIILVGSSMGGWLALLLGIEKIPIISAIMLMAPAPDFTEIIWRNLPEEDKYRILDENFIYINEIPISHKLIEDGRKHLIMHNEIIDIEVPTAIIHGMQDQSVDYKLSQNLTEKIRSKYLSTKFLKYSDHRLSLISDLGLINNSIKELVEVTADYK